MKNLLLHCRELVTDDIISRLLTPLACAVALLTKSVHFTLCAEYMNTHLSLTVLFIIMIYVMWILM